MDETAPGLGMGQDALAAWLGDRLPEAGALRSVAKFPTGQSNPTFRLRMDFADLVLRTKPPGRLLASAHQVEREFRVMAALGPQGVPVPRVRALAADADAPSGRAFFVMDHLEGRIFWDPALPEVPRDERGSFYAAMARALARLHAVDPAAAGLAGYGRPGGYFARQTARWATQYRASVATPLPAMERIAAWLGAHLPEEDGEVAVAHGDWRLDNLIFAPDRPEVIGILDWELSTLGPPVADLAYQCMQWRLPHDGALRGLGGLDRAALGLPTEAEYVALYAAERGQGEVRDWHFALVFAFFRLAAILAGVGARAAAGNASNPETGRAYGRAVPVLADLAEQAMMEQAAGATGNG